MSFSSSLALLDGFCVLRPRQVSIDSVCVCLGKLTVGGWPVWFAALRLARGSGPTMSARSGPWRLDRRGVGLGPEAEGPEGMADGMPSAARPRRAAALKCVHTAIARAARPARPGPPVFVSLACKERVSDAACTARVYPSPSSVLTKGRRETGSKFVVQSLAFFCLGKTVVKKI